MADQPTPQHLDDETPDAICWQFPTIIRFVAGWGPRGVSSQAMVNHGLLRLIGVPDNEHLIHEKWYDITHPHDEGDWDRCEDALHQAPAELCRHMAAWAAENWPEPWAERARAFARIETTGQDHRKSTSMRRTFHFKPIPGRDESYRMLVSRLHAADPKYDGDRDLTLIEKHEIRALATAVLRELPPEERARAYEDSNHPGGANV